MTNLSRIKEIGFELSNLWNYLTRQELCKYFDISEKTLYRYSKALDLPKKIDKKYNEKELKDLYSSKQSFTVPINKQDGDNDIIKFKNWEHFAKWCKSQSHPFKIESKTEMSDITINMDYTSLTNEAEQFASCHS